MIDHRRLQRALFLLQLDGERARAVFARDAGATTALGLGDEELELLLAVDLAAVTADRGDIRRDQVLGNLASEFELSLTLAERLGADRGFLASFLGAPGGAEAVLRDERLPLAFARHARARAAHDPALAALVELERALLVARREPAPALAPGAGEVARSPRAHLVELPLGTHAHAARLRAWIDAGSGAPPAPPGLAAERETLLLLREPAPPPHRLAQVEVEPLEPVVAALLRLAGETLPESRRAAFARERGAEPADLEGFVDELVQEGVLVRGGPAQDR